MKPYPRGGAFDFENSQIPTLGPPPPSFGDMTECNHKLWALTRIIILQLINYSKKLKLAAVLLVKVWLLVMCLQVGSCGNHVAAPRLITTTRSLEEPNGRSQ